MGQSESKWLNSDGTPTEELAARFTAAVTTGPPLTAEELAVLSKVTRVRHFHIECGTATTIDLSALRNIMSVGYGFLAGCSGLTQIDLSPLHNVNSICGGFLSNCRGITALDLSPLRNISNVGYGFLQGCSGLTAVDTSGLCNVTYVNAGFLRGCSSLTALDLSPLRSVTSVGGEFVEGCSSLTALDLSPLRKVTHFGADFLYGCSGLTTIDLSELRSVTYFGDRCLSNCSGLTQLASSPLAKKLGWNGGFPGDFAQLFGAFSARRIPKLTASYVARTTALVIRNFALRDHAIDALKIWSVMRCVVRFLSPLRVPDAVVIAEEKRMLEVVAARTQYR